jgi:hypothetical protein
MKNWPIINRNFDFISMFDGTTPVMAKKKWLTRDHIYLSPVSHPVGHSKLLFI